MGGTGDGLKIQWHSHRSLCPIIAYHWLTKTVSIENAWTLALMRSMSLAPGKRRSGTPLHWIFTSKNTQQHWPINGRRDIILAAELSRNQLKTAFQETNPFETKSIMSSTITFSITHWNEDMDTLRQTLPIFSSQCGSCGLTLAFVHGQRAKSERKTTNGRDTSVNYAKMCIYCVL